MVTKEFLKPTKGKILIFILLMVFTSLYVCWEFSSTRVCEGAINLPYGNLEPPASCPLCHTYDLFPFSLGFIIPDYFLSCLIIYSINKMKKNETQTS